MSDIRVELAGDGDVHVAHVGDLDPITLYRILQLRADVFVVEQQCAYADLDGKDLDARTLQLWVEQDGQVVATLRLLADPAGRRIGRVAVARSARGRGLASALVARAIGLAGDQPMVLDAQSYLEAWYERLGFRRYGDEFLDDDIPHIPMIKTAAPPP